VWRPIVSSIARVAALSRRLAGIAIAVWNCGHSGGSSEMAGEVVDGRLDLALVALAGNAPPGLTLIPLASEPIIQSLVEALRDVVSVPIRDHQVDPDPRCGEPRADPPGPRRDRRSDTMSAIGFIGLGAMGSRIAARLLDAGHHLYGTNRAP
jgi:hypothetical protein